MILASGCIFTPRDAAQPDENSVEWIRPIEPGNVLANMRAAVEARQRINYENSLAEGFAFYPLQRDVSEAPPGYYDGFSKARELQAIDKLYTQVDSLRLDWNLAEAEISETPDSAFYLVKGYKLYVSYLGSDQVVYQGDAELTFAFSSSNSQWELLTWDESVSDNPEENSWGRLRAILDVP